MTPIRLSKSNLTRTAQNTTLASLLLSKRPNEALCDRHFQVMAVRAWTSYQGSPKLFYLDLNIQNNTGNLCKIGSVFWYSSEKAILALTSKTLFLQFHSIQIIGCIC